MKNELNIGGPKAADDNVRTFPGLPIDTDIARIALATDPTTTAEQKTAERIKFEKFLDSLLEQDIISRAQETEAVSAFHHLSEAEKVAVGEKITELQNNGSENLKKLLRPLFTTAVALSATAGMTQLAAQVLPQQEVVELNAQLANPHTPPKQKLQIKKQLQAHYHSKHAAAQPQGQDASVQQQRPQHPQQIQTVSHNGQTLTKPQVQAMLAKYPTSANLQKLLAQFGGQIAQPAVPQQKHKPAQVQSQKQYTPRMQSPQQPTGDNRVISLGDASNSIAGHRHLLQTEINQQLQKGQPIQKIVKAFNHATQKFINSDRVLDPFVRARIQQENKAAQQLEGQIATAQIQAATQLPPAQVLTPTQRVDHVQLKEMQKNPWPHIKNLTKLLHHAHQQGSLDHVLNGGKVNNQPLPQYVLTFIQLDDILQKRIRDLKKKTLGPIVQHKPETQRVNHQVRYVHGFQIKPGVDLKGVKQETLHGANYLFKQVLGIANPKLTGGTEPVKGKPREASSSHHISNGTGLDFRIALSQKFLESRGFVRTGIWKGDPIMTGVFGNYKYKLILERHGNHNSGGHLHMQSDFHPRRKEIRQEMEAHQETPIAQLQHQWYGPYTPLAAHITGKCGEIAINTDRRKESIKAGGQGNPIPTLYLEAANCNKKLLETAAVENPSYTHNLKHGRAKGSVGTDYGLCGMNTRHNGDKIKDPRFFNNPLWQVDLCAEMMAQNITWFHGRHKSDTIGRSILKYIKIK